jgi:hypothetical protein
VNLCCSQDGIFVLLLRLVLAAIPLTALGTLLPLATAATHSKGLAAAP